MSLFKTILNFFSRDKSLPQAPTEREWIPLSADNHDGVWIRRMGEEEKLTFLRTFVDVSEEERVKLWQSVILDWQGFYDKVGTSIPFSVQNVEWCYKIGPSVFLSIMKGMQHTLVREFAPPTSNDTPKTPSSPQLPEGPLISERIWESPGFPDFSSARSDLANSIIRYSLTEYSPGPLDSYGIWERLGLAYLSDDSSDRASDIIRKSLAEYHNPEITREIQEQESAFMNGASMTFTGSTYTASTDGVPNYQQAISDHHNLNTMLKCCLSEIENMATTGWMCAPFCFKRVFILARKAKLYTLEKWACDTIIYLCELYDGANEHTKNGHLIGKRMPAYHDALKRLPKVLELIEKEKQTNTEAKQTRGKTKKLADQSNAEAPVELNKPEHTS